MKKTSLLLYGLMIGLTIQACGGDQVQIVLVNQLVNPEMRSSLVKNSSTICEQLNQTGISCQVKLNSVVERPLTIKMFKGGHKTEITQFYEESDLLSRIKAHMN